jgi:hypothetical protein
MNPEEAALVVAHHHPGRLRVRSRVFECDDALREATERWLSEQPGVRGVRSHAPTGSVRVDYDPRRTDAGTLLTATAARVGAVIAEPSRGAPPAQKLFDAARLLDAQILESSGGRVGLGVVIPLALGIGSFGSFFWSVHTRAPRWDNLLYWGMQLFRILNEDQHPRRRRHASVD